MLSRLVTPLRKCLQPKLIFSLRWRRRMRGAGLVAGYPPSLHRLFLPLRHGRHPPPRHQRVCLDMKEVAPCLVTQNKKLSYKQDHVIMIPTVLLKIQMRTEK